MKHYAMEMNDGFVSMDNYYINTSFEMNELSRLRVVTITTSYS